MQDRVTGLELGADDYLCKPFHPRELIIRISKLLRKDGDDIPVVQEPVRFNNFLFNESAHCFLDKNGNDISLTPGEFIIMTNLLEGRGRILSREQLVSAAFQRSEYPSDRTIDVLVSRLRAKFPVNGGEPEIIETVKGFGYRINKAAIK